MHVEPQWVNRQLYPSFIDTKLGEPKIMLCLIALIKRVVELRDAGFRACHCAKEFTLRWIRPLGRWEKLAYECPRLADPSRKPAGGKIFTLNLYCQ
jgi:hypothetical protein